MRHNKKTCMYEHLTEADKTKIEKLNLFRFDNDWFLVLYISCIGLFLYSFFMPYLGWRHKPLNPPKDLNEYLNQLARMTLFFSPMYLLAISNLVIKTFELKKEIKTIKFTTVKFKSRLIFKRRIIIFEPFLLVIYKRPLQYHDLSEGTAVRMELTYFGRLLNYEIEKNYGAQQQV